jgi:predicted DNA binding CopG/RHH family protein
MKEEYNLDGLKERPSKVLNKLTIRKTIRLDLDVLAWLQEMAESEGIPYQTLLNSTLKKAMKSKEQDLSHLVSRIEKLEGKVG